MWVRILLGVLNTGQMIIDLNKMDRLIKRNVDTYTRKQLIQLMQAVSYAEVDSEDDAKLKFHLKQYIENFLYKKFNYLYSYYLKMLYGTGNDFVNSTEISVNRQVTKESKKVAVLYEYQMN